MKKHISWKERLKYWFDNLMSKGTPSLVLILFIITAVVVIVAGVISALIDGAPGLGILNSVWVSLMHAIDAGTLAGNEGNVAYIVLMSIVTICGIFITSMLIGIINSGIESKMTSLRKGKSQVLESGHVVILGFHEGTFTVLTELIEANANQKDGVIVIMDTREKEEMEDLISQRICEFKSTRIICRRGQYTDFNDLNICSVDTCKSIIIQSEDDFTTIKTILAVTYLLKAINNQDSYVVAVIQNYDNIESAKIAGEGRAEIFYFKDTISRIMAHVCRQPGISNVFMELFDYGGDEIYIEAIDGLEGRTMGELHRYFQSSTVLGIQKGEQSLLNPPSDTPVEKNDRIIILAEDDGVSKPLETPAPIDKTRWTLQNVIKEQPQHILILGCNEFLPGILMEEDQYVTEGSIITVAAEEGELCETYLPKSTELNRITLRVKTCSIYVKAELKKMITEDISSVLILSSVTHMAENADAKTLMLLLQLKDISKELGIKIKVASEMQKVENQKLAEVTGVNDFVISSNLTSLMVTQISQTRILKDVFEELLVSDGSEIYMKPVENYVLLATPVSLFTAAGAAAEKEEVFIGYRKVDAQSKDFHITLNQRKDECVVFEKGDCLIVLAQD